MRVPDHYRTAYFDPGEDFGWALGHDLVLVARGIEKMRRVEDEFWALLNDPSDPSNMFNDEGLYRDEVDYEAVSKLPIGRIVIENFRIYPWKAQQLAWDEVRTAQSIGAIKFQARQRHIPVVVQPAAIKKAAVAAGAEELFDRPLHENRHSNDAIMHFVFYTSTELLGLYMPVEKENEGDDL